ncbi:MAG: RNA methyltransferase [Crocinitomicaceae bacterium]|nr:RNA methyltransferase [Crocinitomicaceae bacterium]
MNRKLKLEELNRIKVDEFKSEKKTPLIVILDDIRSLNNIGSVFRTSDAFKIEKIYLCGITAQPPHREIQKTALGATESVEWEYRENILDLLQELKSKDIQLIAVEQAEKTVLLNEFHPDPNGKVALIFGNEVLGVNQKVIDQADFVLEIPQFGTKHSLNISVSCGIVLWDLFLKMTK